MRCIKYADVSCKYLLHMSISFNEISYTRYTINLLEYLISQERVVRRDSSVRPRIEGRPLPREISVDESFKCIGEILSLLS